MAKEGSFFYGWVMVGICVVSMILIYGIRHSFSVFFSPIQFRLFQIQCPLLHTPLFTATGPRRYPEVAVKNVDKALWPHSFQIHEQGRELVFHMIGKV